MTPTTTTTHIHTDCQKLQQRDSCAVLTLCNLLIKDGRETILVLHHPAPADLNVMNFTTPLPAMMAKGGGKCVCVCLQHSHM